MPLFVTLVLITLLASEVIAFTNPRSGSSHDTSRRFQLCGKKPKRKSAQGGASVSSESTVSSAEAPRRVTTQINVPVRQQIAWAKALKRIQSQSKCYVDLIIKSNY